MDEDWTGFRIAPLRVGEGGDGWSPPAESAGRAGPAEWTWTSSPGFVFDFRGDLIAKVRSYSDPDEAVRRLGARVAGHRGGR